MSVLVLLSILFTIGNNAFEFNNVTRYTNLLAVTQSGWKSSSIDTFDLTTAIQKEYVRYTSNTNVILKLSHVDTFCWQKKTFYIPFRMFEAYSCSRGVWRRLLSASINTQVIGIDILNLNGRRF